MLQHGHCLLIILVGMMHVMKDPRGGGVVLSVILFLNTAYSLAAIVW